MSQAKPNLIPIFALGVTFMHSNAPIDTEKTLKQFMECKKVTYFQFYYCYA